MKRKESVSIIGAGWLGEPLAIKMQDAEFTVKVSKTTFEGKAELIKKGLNAVKYDALNESKLPEELLSDIVIITIPPSVVKNKLNLQLSYSDIISNIVASCENSGITRLMIFTSSTGIYPQRSQEIDENSEIDQTSRALTIHQAENVFTKGNLQYIIFRFGGLSGLDRHPGSRKFTNSLPGNETINMVFLEDAIQAILFGINNSLEGIFNVVAPRHVTRKEYYINCYNKIGATINYTNEIENPIQRIISSKKIIERGFEFQYENPIEFPLK